MEPSPPHGQLDPDVRRRRIHVHADYVRTVTTAPCIDGQRLRRDADRDGIGKLVVGAVVHTGGRGE